LYIIRPNFHYSSLHATSLLSLQGLVHRTGHWQALRDADGDGSSGRIGVGDDNNNDDDTDVDSDDGDDCLEGSAKALSSSYSKKLTRQ
jgi:hypothetical protein